MASGMLARPGALRDALEDGGSLPLDGAAWQGLDDAAASAAGSLAIPSDDVLVAVADDDAGIPVHAAWHPIQLEVGSVHASRANCRRCPASTPAAR